MNTKSEQPSSEYLSDYENPKITQSLIDLSRLGSFRIMEVHSPGPGLASPNLRIRLTYHHMSKTCSDLFFDFSVCKRALQEDYRGYANALASHIQLFVQKCYIDLRDNVHWDIRDYVLPDDLRYFESEYPKPFLKELFRAQREVVADIVASVREDIGGAGCYIGLEDEGC